jgi:DNA-binding NarL/FixJ family response regulator
MKVIIIEDHKLVGDMLMLSCRSIMPAAEFSRAENGEQGLALCQSAKPDLLFLDLVLPDCDGLDLLPKISAVSASTKVIALTSFADEFTIHRLLLATIHGFIAKNDQPLDRLGEAIETVMAGGQYFSPLVQKMKASLRSNPRSFDKVLSAHEQKLLGLFGEGLTNEAVAAVVGLSANTVKVHRRNILGKLGLHSTPELIHYALEKGFTRVGRHQAWLG